jgi:xylose isomerase
MDIYVNLEYKHHKNITTSIKLLINAKPQNVFYFQYELLATTMIGSNFSIDIQIPYHKKLMLNLGHQKDVACDVTFGTNEKVLSSILI